MKITKTITTETWIDEKTIQEISKQSNGYFVRYSEYGMHFDCISREEHDALLKAFKGKVITDKESVDASHYVIDHIQSYWGNKYGGTIQVGGLQTSIEYDTYKTLRKRLPKLEKKM